MALHWNWKLQYPSTKTIMTSAAHKVLVNIAHVAQEINARFQLGCLPMVSPKMTSPKEGIKFHRFAGIFPEQFLTEGGRHREAVVAADQRMVIRYFRDDLAGFVHDVSHVAASNPTQAMHPNNGTLGGRLKLYVILDQQIAGTLCTMPCVSAIPFSGIHSLSRPS